jgi:hypothetical protein
VHKDYFYSLLREKYGTDITQIYERYEDVHKALKDIYGANHEAIERKFVDILQNRSLLRVYSKLPEILPFSERVRSLYEDHDLGRKPLHSIS